MGYHVAATVVNSVQAFRVLKNGGIDLVLMDVKIEGTVDGITAAKTIAAQYDIPLIFVTAFNDPKIKKRIDQTPHRGHIFKPFRDADIRKAIQDALH